jgi:hypothetical protein
MRILAIVAVLFAAPLAACGHRHDTTTVVVPPGSTVVSPAGTKVEHERKDN